MDGVLKSFGYVLCFIVAVYKLVVRSVRPLVCYSLARLQRLLIRSVLGMVRRHARVPGHIGFIMDGNRRFAERNSLPRKSLGHLHGFRKLEEVGFSFFQASMRRNLVNDQSAWDVRRFLSALKGSMFSLTD